MDLKEKIKNIDTNLLEKKVEKLEVKKFKELNYGDYFIRYDYYKIYNIYIKIDGDDENVVNVRTGKLGFICKDEDVIKIFYNNKVKIEDIQCGNYFKYKEDIYIKTPRESQSMGETHYFATDIRNGSEYTFSNGFKVEPVNVEIIEK